MSIALGEKVGARSEPIAAKEHIFLIAGEMSGDLLGSQLAKSLKRLIPQLPLFGIAGPLMIREGVRPISGFDKLQVMGVLDVITHLPQLIYQFHHIEQHILKNQPKAVIFIDYPGFNLRLAKSLRAKGYKGKLIHYVCPSVWVWGKGRIKQMAKHLDLLLTLFPFEPPLFSKTTLAVKHVGHPLSEKFLSYNYDELWKQRVGLKDKGELLAIFPGSRAQEIIRTYPLQVEAARLLKKNHPDIAIGVSLIDSQFAPLIKKLSKDLKVTLVPHHYTYELMRDARASIAKSGTVTLELAWSQTPSVILYGVSPLNRLIAKYLLKLDLPHYCIVNILLNRTVFPELIKEGFDPENIADHVESLWSDGQAREKCRLGCQEAWDLLSRNGPHSPSERAALAIRDLLL